MYRDFLCTFCPARAQPPPWSSSPTRVWHLLQLKNPQRHLIITLSPQFTLGFTLDVRHRASLDKCMMTCIHHYRVMWISFTALKILCALTYRSPRPTNPGNHWSFSCLHSTAFAKMSCHWNHSVCNLFRLATFTWSDAFCFLFLCLASSFLCSSKWYSIVWMYHSSFIHSPTEGHLGCFQVLAALNKATVNIHAQVFV